MGKNSNNKNIYPIASSSSILWEGEDLQCIKVCTGDMVSDIVYKLALELCAVKSAYDLKDTDLKCIVDSCISCPEPAKTLKIILQLIINKVCAIDAIIQTLSGATTAVDEKIITLANCFLPLSNADGDPITKLAHSDYTRLIASMVCNHNSRLNGVETRTSTLEAEYNALVNQISGLAAVPLVSPRCVAQTNSPIAVTAAWELLETQFCELRTSLGLPGEISQAAGRQLTNLGGLPKLAGNGTMSTITGWKNTISTAADSISNLWLTLNDIRGAVQYMSDNCCKVNCDSIKVDFDIKLNDTRTIATLFFAAKSKIPTGFTDGDVLGNKITITDTAGAVFETYIKVANEAANIEGFAMDLSGSPLDANSDYTFSMDAVMTNGSLTCQKCINKLATYKDTCSYCEVTVVGNHTTGSIAGELVIVYQN
jgi:hypothetical protein